MSELMRARGIECHPETLAPTLNPETFETNVSEPVHRRRRRGRPEHRQHLHRERALSRRTDHQGPRRIGGFQEA